MHPILIQIGPLTIYSYGVLVAAAFLAAVTTAAARARRAGWPADLVYDASIVILAGSIIGSRILYILEEPAEFVGRPLEAFMIWRGGLSYFGGLLGAVIAAVVFLKVRGRNVAAAFDILVPSVALGHAIGRIGCLLNGCCFGAVPSRPIPWAVVFPEGSLAHSHQLYEAGILPPGAALSLPVHPVQIYEALAELCIFAILAARFPRRRFDGEIFCLYLLLYGAARFALEFFRADSPAAVFVGGAGLTLPQAWSLAAFLVAAAVLIIRRPGRSARRTP
ncbi:MAG: prolipoprotein diacylglyceryl transferase [bacterium]|nr:prolipoprotein diacylglyceryl transferase [bacterium]